jgi:plasmid maintenance system killer protein
MRLLSDTGVEEVYHLGTGMGLQKHIARRAQRIISLLLAARGWQDVGVVAKGRIARWPNTPGKYGIPVEGKWYITFGWQPTIGAVGIGIERHKPITGHDTS